MIENYDSSVKASVGEEEKKTGYIYYIYMYMYIESIDKKIKGKIMVGQEHTKCKNWQGMYNVKNTKGRGARGVLE